MPCQRQGVDPVLRTYNTLIIACNMCGQPHEVRPCWVMRAAYLLTWLQLRT